MAAVIVWRDFATGQLWRGTAAAMAIARQHGQRPDKVDDLAVRLDWRLRVCPPPMYIPPAPVQCQEWATVGCEWD